MPEIEEYFYWLIKHCGLEINHNFSQLIYSSELEQVDVQVSDIQRISHMRATIGRSTSAANLALVVPDLKFYWIAKMYQTLSKSSHINTRLFRENDEAFNWLGFDNPLI